MISAVLRSDSVSIRGADGKPLKTIIEGANTKISNKKTEALIAVRLH
jgi:hypothetical protein